jgi:hypothetical protein
LYFPNYPVNTIRYLDPEDAPAPLPDNHNDPVINGSDVGNPVNIELPLALMIPLALIAPDAVMFVNV